jgi:hypothetical protein
MWLIRIYNVVGELCHFEAETGLFIPSASRLRDVAWATQRCAMEFTSQVSSDENRFHKFSILLICESLSPPIDFRDCGRLTTMGLIIVP